MKVWIGLKSDQQRSLCADICSYSKQRGEGSAFQHCGCLIWLLEGGASPLLQNQPEPRCSLQCTWPSSGWGNLKLFLAAMTKLKTCCSSGPYRASLILQEEQAAVNLEVFWLFNLSHHCNTPCTKIRQLKYQHAAGEYLCIPGALSWNRDFSKMSGFLIFSLYLNVWDCLCCKAVKLFMTVDLLWLYFFFTCFPSNGSSFINFQCHSKSAITYPQRAAHTWPLSL